MMFLEAVNLPESLVDLINISQDFNVQKSLHRCFFHTTLYLQLYMYNEHLKIQ